MSACCFLRITLSNASLTSTHSLPRAVVDLYPELLVALVLAFEELDIFLTAGDLVDVVADGPHVFVLFFGFGEDEDGEEEGDEDEVEEELHGDDTVKIDVSC